MSLFELAVTDRPVEHSRFARAWSHWPRWTAWGAMFWSASYALAGARWWSGADWYPFANVPLDRASLSLLESAPSDVVGPAFVTVGLLGVGAAAVFLSPRSTAGARRVAVAFGAVLRAA